MSAELEKGTEVDRQAPGGRGAGVVASAAAAARLDAIEPFLAMVISERARALEATGAHVVHMELGEPDFDTPAPIREAAARAMAQGKTHYTHSLGLPELRQAIADHYGRTYGVSVNPDQIMVTPGTSPALAVLFLALLNPGDEVILSDPGYACYWNFVRLAGGVPRAVPVYEEDGFSYRPSEIHARLSPRTRAILVNSPANPTGCVMPAEDLASVARLAEEAQETFGAACYVVSDEIYHGLNYGGPGQKDHSMLEFTRRAFVLNGFSKLYAMTGWRLGYIIAPPEFMRPLQKLQQNVLICAPSIAQWAGIAALTECQEDVARMRRTYDERRRFVLRRLAEMGLPVGREPLGAFYVLANVRRFSHDSYRLAFDLLEKAHVAVTPGVDFGRNAEGYLRISYATRIEELAEGLDRMERYFASAGGEDAGRTM